MEEIEERSAVTARRAEDLVRLFLGCLTDGRKLITTDILPIERTRDMALIGQGQAAVDPFVNRFVPTPTDYGDIADAMAAFWLFILLDAGPDTRLDEHLLPPPSYRIAQKFHGMNGLPFLWEEFIKVTGAICRATPPSQRLPVEAQALLDLCPTEFAFAPSL